MIFIGIDPGLSGAAVALDLHGGAVYFEPPSTDGNIRVHESLKIFGFLVPFADRATAVLEQVRLDQRDARHMVSAEKLIRSHECWRTNLEILKIPTQHLYPVQWRKPLGLSGDDGEVYVNEALRLYPDCRTWLYYKSRNGRWAMNHNRAEAVLMAHLAKIQHLEQAA